MAKGPWVFEVIMEADNLWPGNQLYDTMDYAKFCAEQDYAEHYPVDEDQTLSWDFLVKNVDLMYITGDDGPEPTGVEIRVRHVNSLKEK